MTKQLETMTISRKALDVCEAFDMRPTVRNLVHAQRALDTKNLGITELPYTGFFGRSFEVESASRPDEIVHIVEFYPFEPSCTCEAFRQGTGECRHILAVRIFDAETTPVKIPHKGKHSESKGGRQVSYFCGGNGTAYQFEVKDIIEVDENHLTVPAFYLERHGFNGSMAT